MSPLFLCRMAHFARGVISIAPARRMSQADSGCRVFQPLPIGPSLSRKFPSTRGKARSSCGRSRVEAPLCKLETATKRVPTFRSSLRDGNYEEDSSPLFSRCCDIDLLSVEPTVGIASVRRITTLRPPKLQLNSRRLRP
jgi:hypothetical protein